MLGAMWDETPRLEVGIIPQIFFADSLAASEVGLEFLASQLFETNIDRSELMARHFECLHCLGEEEAGDRDSL